MNEDTVLQNISSSMSQIKEKVQKNCESVVELSACAYHYQN